MLTLSLANPYASLLISGAKRWETRPWKPGPRNLAIIQREGLLIHASLSKKYAFLQGLPPFWSYLSKMGTLPYGAIIGEIRIGRIIRTEEWLKEFKPVKGSPWFDEWCFGDYSPGRWAWEILDPIKFDEPIAAKGALSLWPHPKPVKHAIPDLSLNKI